MEIGDFRQKQRLVLAIESAGFWNINLPFKITFLKCNTIEDNIKCLIILCTYKFRSQNEGSVYMGRLNEKQFNIL